MQREIDEVADWVLDLLGELRRALRRRVVADNGTRLPGRLRPSRRRSRCKRTVEKHPYCDGPRKRVVFAHGSKSQHITGSNLTIPRGASGH